MKTIRKQIYRHGKRNETHCVGVQDNLLNGELFIGHHVAVRFFIDYYYSVFLSGGGLISPTSVSTCEKMPPVEVTVRGIENLVNHIDDTKATGRDRISPWILKRC